jgi:DNA-binding transcriptional LysR family regulator
MALIYGYAAEKENHGASAVVFILAHFPYPAVKYRYGKEIFLMNLAEIETFLTIVSTGSITRTADLLFISQPTVSHRLRSIEEELGFPLIVRRKGLKQVDLTPKGADFIPIAERLLALWKETQLLRLSEEQIPITIGCTDSLNTALLAPLYRKIMVSDEQIVLNIRTHQSSELYQLLNNHDIDIGFVYHKLHYKNIITEKIYEEPLYLVQSEHPAVPKALIHTDELNPSSSIFLSWDDQYQIWYDRWMAASARPLLTVDTITMLSRLWLDDSCWLIAPASVVRELSRKRRLFVSKIKNAPPLRVCYKITHTTPRLSSVRAVERFETLLEEHIQSLTFTFPIGELIGPGITEPQP